MHHVHACLYACKAYAMHAGMVARMHMHVCLYVYIHLSLIGAVHKVCFAPGEWEVWECVAVCDREGCKDHNVAFTRFFYHTYNML